MTLLTVRAALIFAMALGAAAIATALVLKEGKSWPTALLSGAASFLGTAAFTNEVVL